MSSLEVKKDEYNFHNPCSIYTPLYSAKNELLRRWENQDLKEQVEQFLEGCIPDFLIEEPKAYLARNILTPNYETFRFYTLARTIGLKPVCPEFTNDKFSAKNELKYYLGKLYSFEGLGKNGGIKIRSMNIIDFEKSEGLKINEIKTIFGDTLTNFHHKLYNYAAPKNKIEIYDISDWITRKGYEPEKFYIYFLTLFVRNGILFENFIHKEGKDEAVFTKNVVIPAFNKIVETFKVKPIIVPLLPLNDEIDRHWFYYPDYIKNNLCSN